MDRWAYCTTGQLRPAVGVDDDDSSQDAALMRAIESAAEEIDGELLVTFRIQQAVVYLAARARDVLDTPPLLSLTELATDEDGDGTYETTWTASTDYILAPENSPFRKRPYRQIRATTRGTKRFPRWIYGADAMENPYLGIGGYQYGALASRPEETEAPSSVRATGTWGWWLARRTIAATLDGAINDSVQSVVVDGVAELSPGATIIVGSEQMFISAINTTSKTLTVERGINGTTAASHLDNAAIQLEGYPAGINQAALLTAELLYRRSITDFGLLTLPGQNGSQYVKKLPAFDDNARRLLRQYKDVPV